MKITIAYLPGEEQEAESIRRYVESQLSPAKTWKTEHPPYKHIYVKTKQTNKA